MTTELVDRVTRGKISSLHGNINRVLEARALGVPPSILAESLRLQGCPVSNELITELYNGGYEALTARNVSKKALTTINNSAMYILGLVTRWTSFVKHD